MRKLIAVTLVAAVSLSVACSSSEVPSTVSRPPRSPDGSKSMRESDRSSNANPELKTDSKQGEENERANATEQSSSQPILVEPATRDGAWCVEDLSLDLESQGRPPRYVDIVAACLRELRDYLQLEVTVKGRVPAHMPDGDTSASIGFELSSSAGDESYVWAEADRNGWTAYITRGQGRRELPRALSSGGRGMQLMLRWSALKGARRLRWYAESSWLRAGLLATSWAFDRAPENGVASFSRRRGTG